MTKQKTFKSVAYNLVSNGRYYLSYSTTNSGRRGAKGLHVAIWEDHHKRKVPRGYIVHHVDGDTMNNDVSNLQCVSRKEHAALHPNAEATRESIKLAQHAAKKWHGSEQGREWHREHSKKVWSKIRVSGIAPKRNADACRRNLELGREAAKAWHKTEEGRNFHRELGRKTWANRCKVQVRCKNCGEPWETYFPMRAKFCKPLCRNRFYNQLKSP